MIARGLWCLALGATLIGLSDVRSQSAAPSAMTPSTHSREAFVMGTRAVLTTYAEQRGPALRRLERMLRVIEETETELSTWRADSEVSRINVAAGAGPQLLSPATCRLMARLSRQVADTDGAFDPAIGSLVDAWDLHGRGRVPTARVLAAARAHAGWRHVQFDGHRCTVALSAGSSLDVGSFGKGEALDRVRTAIGEMSPWMIDFGGQVAVSSVSPDGTGWPVSIAYPQRRDTPAITITLNSGSLSTSAGSERDLWSDGQRVGHILDPRTGEPTRFEGSVTVWSENGLTADALSTALFVMGPSEGFHWADTHDVAALFLLVSADGALERHATRAFSSCCPLRR